MIILESTFWESPGNMIQDQFIEIEFQIARNSRYPRVRDFTYFGAGDVYVRPNTHMETKV